MITGQVLNIYIAFTAAGPMQSRPNVRAVPGQGLEGDRYFIGDGTFSKRKKLAHDQEITLIEVEAMEALQREHSIALEYGQSRRNIITRGVALNHLVGKEFSIGEVRIKGIRLCEPCGHLESLTQKGVKSGLVHRGGLRAQILTEGVIHVGDSITVAQTQRSPACV